MALQSEAYDIKSVLTADDALKELKANPPFFFLVDLTLPSKDGYEFAKLIRSDSKLNKIKVMLLSSAFDPIDPQKLAASGADGYIVKPFDPSDLRKKLREIADAPPAFPMGSHVKGSVSGFQVNVPNDVPPPAPNLKTEEPSETEIEMGGDADSILARLMSSEEGDMPAVEPPITSPSLSTIGIDSADTPPPPPPPSQEGVLDLSEALGSDRTAMIDFQAGETDFPVQEKEKTLSKAISTLEASKNLPPAFSKVASTPASEIPPPKEEPLSANAQALSAFFEAELDSKPASPPQKAPETPPAAPTAPSDDSFFDASMESIEWASPAKESLDSWSSNTPNFSQAEENLPPANIPPASKPVSKPAISSMSAPSSISEVEPASLFDSPPPFTAPVEEAPPAFKKEVAAGPKSPSGASAAGNPLFDVGGSNFTFADDYIQRITKAFSGAINEAAVPNSHEGLFHSESNDAPHAQPAPKPVASSTNLTSGAWSPEDAKKIEQMVREEVQMVVREVVEKVAWEIIPELAENIIKKELDKVLKQMET